MRHIGQRVPSPETWTAIFDAWEAELRRVSAAREDGHLDWWGGKASLLGTLSGAVARGLPEGRAVVAAPSSRRRGPDAEEGRCDLWIRTPDVSADVEARVVWPKSVKGLKSVRKALREAGRSLRDMRRSERDPLGLALVFVVPTFRRKLDGVEVRERLLSIERELRDLLEDTDVGLIAGYLHDDATLSAWEDADAEHHWPGVIVVGRVVWGETAPAAELSGALPESDCEEEVLASEAGSLEAATLDVGRVDDGDTFDGDVGDLDEDGLEGEASEGAAGEDDDADEDDLPVEGEEAPDEAEAAR